MPEPTSPRDILARVMADGRKVLVPHLAGLLKSDRIAEVPSDEERRIFWQRAVTPEQEVELWNQAMQQRGLTPETMTPEQALDIGLGISQQVYPGRWDILTGEGRDTQAKQSRWAWKHTRMGPPKEMQDAQTGQGVPPQPWPVRPPDQPLRQGAVDQGPVRPVVPEGSVAAAGREPYGVGAA